MAELEQDPAPHPIEVVLKAVSPTVLDFVSGDVQRLAEQPQYLAVGLKISGLITETLGTVLGAAAGGPLAGVVTYLCGRAMSLAGERAQK